MLAKLRAYLLVIVVSLVGLLLLANIYLIYQNSLVISSNKEQQETAEDVRVNTLEVIRSLHLLDLAVRSYAFVKGDHFLRAADNAIKDNAKALSRLEVELASQKFPMEEFYQLKDSVDTYLVLAKKMLDLLEEGSEEKFVKILSTDPGYRVWLQHQKFSQRITGFEDSISGNAKVRYEAALKNSYLLQILLFVVAMPTLGYTAYYTKKVISVSEQLRKSELEKSALLLDQNRLLEKIVYERTREILAQNEEISAQNEEMVAHNEQLVLQQQEIELQRNNLAKQNENLTEAKHIIEAQNQLIQRKNDELGVEVERQTNDLKQTNLELIEHNNRLEQFAFIISHNLRAPMARLVGLSTILDFAKDPKETLDIVQLMVKSTHDLDQVIKDLTLILGIQKMNTQVLTEIQFDDLLQKVLKSLEEEIKETQTKITSDFSGVNYITSLYPYLESIFYNLVSNAIKYRHPGRLPRIHIESRQVDSYVLITFADNGLGLDLEKHGENLFNLYKRFHFHTEGKGMGLYLVKTQLAALGGKIDVRSYLNEGTVFTIYLKQG